MKAWMIKDKDTGQYLSYWIPAERKMQFDSRITSANIITSIPFLKMEIKRLNKHYPDLKLQAVQVEIKECE
jgi:hypothetical protein